MSNSDFLHEILHLRKQCLAKIDDDSDELTNFYKQLMEWEQQIINELKKFIQDKFHEIKQKYIETNRQLIQHLDKLYSNCSINNINQNKKKLIENFNNQNSPIELFSSKQIDFNQYIQLNTNHLNDIQRSLILGNNTNYLNLSSYKLFSTVSIQSNLSSLFATYNRFLVYYDHHTLSTSLNIFDLQSYLEQSKTNRSCLKLRVPCKQLQGKLMHIEYCSYLQGVLLATGSKLFLLEISNTGTNYHLKEYYDVVHGSSLGILQKFACHPTEPNLIYLLIKTFSHYILIQFDLSKSSYIGKKWDYPKDDNYVPTTTTDNNITRNNSQITFINDFVVGKNLLIFAVTYGLHDNLSYQFHIRSPDMTLQYRLILNTTSSPLHICKLPCDYSSSWNKEEQFLVIYEKSKILSLYNINPIDINDNIQLINEIILDTEPEYIGFVNNDLSTLLIRNLFYIAIYKQMNIRLSSIISHKQK